MAWRRTEGCRAYPPSAKTITTTLCWCSSPRRRVVAFVQIRRRKGIRAAVLLQQRRFVGRTGSQRAQKTQCNSSTRGPLVKALVRENRRDIDRKKLTATLQSVVDRKNHDGNGTIAYQLHTRRGRREHGAGICRRLLSELSRPVWKLTSASVITPPHAIEQRLPSSRRR